MPDVLVDTGALIASLDRSDPAHERCVETLKTIHEPLLTVWPAVTEAMHMLADIPRATEILCDMIADGNLRLLDLAASDFRRIRVLMAKYRDRPMDVADAALVRAAEREQLTRIISFDSDFHIYRLPRRGRFTVLP